ncbi:unnamed protein product, partial [Brassica oleracea]
GLVIVSYKDSISPYSYVLRLSLSLSLSLSHFIIFSILRNRKRDDDQDDTPQRLDDEGETRKISTFWTKGGDTEAVCPCQCGE